MSMIDELIERTQPHIDAAIEDPNINVNFRVMKLLVDKMTIDGALDDESNISRSLAARLVMAMKIQVSEGTDAEKVADFLFSGYRMMFIMSKDLAGAFDADVLLGACRHLSIEG